MNYRDEQLLQTLSPMQLCSCFPFIMQTLLLQIPACS